MQINIKEKSVIELKAMVYDEIGRMEGAQNNIKTLNQEIAGRVGNLPAHSSQEAEKPITQE